ncbi:MAG: 2Fe-2S iron-sulfur cluster-binding protein [Anaerolineales bacterium]|nr:2Fe-2S iron-sulfur cluster-binding protein [Anaerolineales bacterium]MDW8278109.1 2Fe-2S iron-sulfur cluster-binding protein [Anaerolineales bacterium]
MPEQWTLTLRLYRQKANEAPRYDTFTLQVNPDEYVLDAVERVWAFHDRSLCFRHACHHSTCGACGMRVNGVEKLTCITPLRAVTQNGAVLTIEPLRNFPIVSDLVVDMGDLYRKMERVNARAVLPVTEAEIEHPASTWNPEDAQYLRLSDCLECGLCISACPVAATTAAYLGPAPLAAIQDQGMRRHPELLPLADSEDGVWRCHSAFECTAVCPSFVDPARRIMDLRRQVVGAKLRQVFGK